MRKRHRRSIFWILIIILGSNMACRLEFGLGAPRSSQHEIISASSALSQQTMIQDATPFPTPAPTDEVIPDKIDIATGDDTPQTATPSPTPTATTTPLSKLVPTETTRDGASLAPTSTPGPIIPTPTPIPLLPARYPPKQIIIPAIELDAPIASIGWNVITIDGVKTSIWETPDNAAGWHKTSALPGHNNNVVLSGHHNLGLEVFRDLVDLEVGDKIILLADIYEYQYQITDRFIVPERDVSEEQRKQNAQWIMPTIDERLTLVTCWPYHDNSHRLIVVARPTGYTG